jgi:hypothetical protein
MQSSAPIEGWPEEPYISTGHLPPAELVQKLIPQAQAKFRSNNEGENSQVYPALARCDGRVGLLDGYPSLAPSELCACRDPGVGQGSSRYVRGACATNKLKTCG